MEPSERKNQKLMDEMTFQLRESDTFLVIVSSRAGEGTKLGLTTQYWRLGNPAYAANMLGTIEVVKAEMIEYLLAETTLEEGEGPPEEA